MKRVLVSTGRIVLAVVLVFILLLAPGILIVPVTLLVGWWWSLGRLFTVWHPAPHAVVVFFLAVIVLVVGTHVFLRWLHGRLKNGEAVGKSPAWRWKWTLCGFAMIFCTLLGICCIVLTTHQLYWVSKSSDPVFTDPILDRVAMIRSLFSLNQEADAVKWDSTRTRAAFWQRVFTSPGQPASEIFQPIWIEKDGMTLRAIILVPRHPLQYSKARIMVMEPGTNHAEKLSELPKVLVSFGLGRPDEFASPPPPPRP
jgi:hypothetical protein